MEPEPPRQPPPAETSRPPGLPGPAREAREWAAVAERLRQADNFHAAAAALDVAFGLDPHNPVIRQRRRQLLDRLSLTDHGIAFRYVPAGTFLMGSTHGEGDEQPPHPVQLNHFWLSETPVSWADYCRLMDFEPPLTGMPKPPEVEPAPIQQAGGKAAFDVERFTIMNANKIRLQYCEDRTLRALDWHAHALGQTWTRAGQVQTSQELFGHPPRSDPDSPWTYATKPMVAVRHSDAERLCVRLSALSAPSAAYCLPTEAEWERAARGGLVGCRYPWGDEPPGPERCDFDRFNQFSILPMKRFAPNDYGLYAMSGCVWEWTADWYDAESYAEGPVRDPRGPSQGKQKVLRGGSWSDGPEAVTVSFRMSHDCGERLDALSPNIGFRLCRVEPVPPPPLPPPPAGDGG